MTEKRSMTVAHIRTRQQRTSGRNDENMVLPSTHRVGVCSAWRHTMSLSLKNDVVIMHAHSSSLPKHYIRRLLAVDIMSHRNMNFFFVIVVVLFEKFQHMCRTVQLCSRHRHCLTHRLETLQVRLPHVVTDIIAAFDVARFP